jgi:hypothetical protein
VTRALPIDVAVDVAAWFEQLPAKVHRGLMCRLACLSAVMRRYFSRGHRACRGASQGVVAGIAGLSGTRPGYGRRPTWSMWTVCLSSSTV